MSDDSWLEHKDLVFLWLVPPRTYDEAIIRYTLFFWPFTIFAWLMILACIGAFIATVLFCIYGCYCTIVIGFRYLKPRCNYNCTISIIITCILCIAMLEIFLQSEPSTWLFKRDRSCKCCICKCDEGYEPETFDWNCKSEERLKCVAEYCHGLCWCRNKDVWASISSNYKSYYGLTLTPFYSWQFGVLIGIGFVFIKAIEKMMTL